MFGELHALGVNYKNKNTYFFQMDMIWLLLNIFQTNNKVMSNVKFVSKTYNK